MERSYKWRLRTIWKRLYLNLLQIHTKRRGVLHKRTVGDDNSVVLWERLDTILSSVTSVSVAVCIYSLKKVK